MLDLNKFTCLELNCNKSYKSESAFCSHYKNKHL